jgi:hypothetical protein
MDPLELGKFILMLAGLAGLYLKMNQAMRQLAGKGEAREIVNDPLHVKEAPEFVTRRECGVMHHGFDTRLTHLEIRFDKHISEVKTTTDALREDITDLRDRIDDKFQTVSDDLREISRSVGRLEGS